MPKQAPKDYDKRGPYQLRRLPELLTFTCGDCGFVKTSTLVASKDGGPEHICNLCYGNAVKREGL